MKKIVVVTLLALAGFYSTTASSAVTADALPAGSSKTRQQVQAELAKAIAAGELREIHGESRANILQAEPSTGSLTRAQVLAELKRARDSGEFVEHSRNSSNWANAPRKYEGTPVSREQVQAEFRRARESGEFRTLNRNQASGI
ncbi:DUF4148 domain-containing protein [Roseateles oligotrophus]|uniref:DUF4148 domain-containing protein n=1 Tax=Roseateles oligotrophus TaxID=1769250 RepID=A0ABT2YH74_9BURK|nr:DUF4148 domain-containing protein [Roseateles oligotrophus]MCV2369346.1 DUF4148 domain-containing protein [Roseateles oligotrophus]